MSDYSCDLEMAQNSNRLVSLKFLLAILITCLFPEIAHFFVLENPETILRYNTSYSLSLRILSHLRIFELKVSDLRKKARDQYFEQKLERNETV